MNDDTTSSGNARAQDPIQRPESDSHLRRTSSQAWMADDLSGFSYKPLFEDKHSGQRTILMRVEPGCVAPPHAHEDLEQVYVVEGEFLTQEDALESIYYRSYEAYFRQHPEEVAELIRLAKKLRNPHAEAYTSVMLFIFSRSPYTPPEPQSRVTWHS